MTRKRREKKKAFITREMDEQKGRKKVKEKR